MIFIYNFSNDKMNILFQTNELLLFNGYNNEDGYIKIGNKLDNITNEDINLIIEKTYNGDFTYLEEDDFLENKTYFNFQIDSKCNNELDKYLESNSLFINDLKIINLHTNSLTTHHVYIVQTKYIHNFNTSTININIYWTIILNINYETILYIGENINIFVGTLNKHNIVEKLNTENYLFYSNSDY